MIELKTLSRKQLQEFITSRKFESYDFLPITEHRANSHILNPKAGDNDVLLTLALEGETLAGYLGTFPDHFISQGKIVKFAWLSTLYVSENFRGKRIAQQLLEKVFEAYQGNIAITEFTKEAEGLYNKTKQFSYITPKIGKRYYFRSDLETFLPAKDPKTKIAIPLLSVADFAANLLVSAKQTLKSKPKFRFEILSKIDAESDAFLTSFYSNRNSKEINWFIENPWVLENEKDQKNYLFSAYSKQFRYFWIKLYSAENQVETCTLFLLRDGHLKIPYLFSNGNLDNLAKFLIYFVADKKVKFVTSYQTELNSVLDKGCDALYSKNFERRYLFHNQFLENLPQNFDPKFQDGDGDCALT